MPSPLLLTGLGMLGYLVRTLFWEVQSMTYFRIASIAAEIASPHGASGYCYRLRFEETGGELILSGLREPLPVGGRTFFFCRRLPHRPDPLLFVWDSSHRFVRSVR